MSELGLPVRQRRSSQAITRARRDTQRAVSCSPSWITRNPRNRSTARLASGRWYLCERSPVELEGAAPRRARLLVAGRLGILEGRFEEPVTKARVDVELVLNSGGLERLPQLFDVLHPGARILIAPVAEDRAVHLRRDLDRCGIGARIRGKSVVRDGRGAVVAPRREQ